MTSKGVLRIKIAGDSSGLKGTLDDAVSQLGKFGKGMKAAGAAVGAAMGATLAVGFAKHLEFDSAQQRLHAQLGGSAEFAKEMGGIAGDLYSDAYGESMGQVSDAVRAVVQSGALMEDATNDQIKSITGQAMSLADAFGTDVTESMRAVGQMIRTGMAPDAQAGLDLIAVANRQLGPQAQDVLDTFTEYGTQFRKLGIDGPMALGLINQSVKAGARDTDVAADALKEFSIRAIDGSKLTAEGFEALGLNAEEMAKKIAAGGPVASEALGLTLDKLRAMEDPVKRDAAAVALFGTQSEDLGAALLAMDTNTAVQGLGQVAGAAKSVDEAMSEQAQNKITSMQRKFEMFAASLVTAEGPLGDLSAGVMAFGGGAVEFASQAGMIVVALRGMGFASIFTGNAFRAMWLAATGPIGIAVALIIGLVTLIIFNWDKVLAISTAVWGAIWATLQAIWGFIERKVAEGVAFVVAKIDYFQRLPGRVADFFGRMKDAAIGKLMELVGWLTGLPGRFLGALGNLGRLLWNAGISLISGFWDGLVSRWNQLMDWARNAMGKLRALWPFSPAKEGPFSGRGYVTYSGKALTEDFAASLRAGMPEILSTARDLMDATRGQLTAPGLAELMANAEAAARAQLRTLAQDAPAAGPAAAAAQPAGGTVRVVFDVDGADEDLKRLFRKAVRNEAGGSAEKFFRATR